ncbi:solute carrier family 22 member 7 [Dermacentor silvarum]|uniref:solute carrier family 22 member 7 n=1 Tax=Dermacentor silvarum TaxID=543639 RepID=UPI002101AC8B|nr:solute carrier family 22 member 7 [Dermacentor silvarum]
MDDASSSSSVPGAYRKPFRKGDQWPTEPPRAMDSMSSSPVAMFRIDGERLKNLIEQTAPKSVLIFGTGPFQRRVLAVTMLCLLVVALHNRVLMVLARPVVHWCRRPDEYLNVPLDEWKNASLPRRPDGSVSECTRYEPALLPPPRELTWLSVVVNRTEVPCDAWEYDLTAGGPTLESQCGRGQWDLVCGRRRPVLVALAASYLLGGVVVMPTAGHCADRVGRRPMLFGAVMVLALSSVATCLVRSLYAFVALRVVTGAAASVAEVTSTLILFEVTPRSGRTGFTTLAFCGLSVLGPFWLSMAARFTYDWRAVQASLALPAALLVPATFWMEESPRWLVVTWRFAEAERVVLWAARVNGLNVDELRPLFSEVVENVKNRHGFPANLPGPPSFWDLLRSSSIRSRSFIAFGCWFFALQAAVCLRPRGRMSGLAVAEVVMAYVMAPLLVLHYMLMKAWGRRRTLALSMTLVSVLTTALAVVIVQQNWFLFKLVMTVAMLVLTCVFATLFVYTAEVFPTVVRGAGYGGATICGRLGLLTAVVVRYLIRLDPLTKDVFALLAVSLGTFTFGLLALLLPETNVMRVPDTIQEAEQEEPVRVDSLLQILLRKRAGYTSQTKL